MTDRVIFKYPMDDASTRVPWGEIRHIGVQNIKDPLPTVWIEHSVDQASNPGPDDSMIEIILVGTGHRFSFDQAATFLGTVVCAEGRLVWHCWQRPASG